MPLVGCAMKRLSKYRVLDKRIVAAVGRGCRSHRRIYCEPAVWRALGRILAGTWGTSPALLSRRLQVLSRRGVIRCAAFNRWRPVPVSIEL